MISFTKSFGSNFSKSTDLKGSIDTDELGFGAYGARNNDYARKISVSNLTFNQMHKMYVANVWIRAIVDKIVERSVEIKPLVKPVNSAADILGGKASKVTDETKKHMEAIWEFTIKNNEVDDSFNTIRKKVTRDVLKYDAGSFEIIKNSNVSKNEVAIEIAALPGNTIKLNVDKKGRFRDEKSAYVQIEGVNKKVAVFAVNELAYLVMNPQSDKVYGLSPLESLVQTVNADLYAAEYNSDFFYNNATPRFAVLMEQVGQGQGNAALRRFRQWWDQELKGNPHRPIVIGSEHGNIKFEKVGLSNEEMQFQDYSRWLLQKIMAVYKMQPIALGLIDTNMGKLNSAEQVRLFKQDAIKPLLTLFAEKINNKIIFNNDGYGFKDVYLDFDLDLADKYDQAKWHQLYLQSGVLTINEIRTQGLGFLPVDWGDVPYLQNNLVPFGLSSDGSESAVPVTDEGSAPPNNSGQTSAGVVSRSLWRKAISNYDGLPVGWENMPLTDRLDIVEKLIAEREKQLSKKYIFPKNM